MVKLLSLAVLAVSTLFILALGFETDTQYTSAAVDNNPLGHQLLRDTIEGTLRSWLHGYLEAYYTQDTKWLSEGFAPGSCHYESPESFNPAFNLTTNAEHCWTQPEYDAFIGVLLPWMHPTAEFKWILVDVEAVSAAAHIYLWEEKVQAAEGVGGGGDVGLVEFIVKADMTEDGTAITSLREFTDSLGALESWKRVSELMAEAAAAKRLLR